MKFSLGKLAWTRAVNECVASDASFAKFVMESLGRHTNCDWGQLTTEDKRANDISLKEGLRLFSAYQHNDVKLWIITEADRSVTTILFTEDY